MENVHMINAKDLVLDLKIDCGTYGTVFKRVGGSDLTEISNLNVLKKLDHPSIVKYFGVSQYLKSTKDENFDRPFIIMELVNGVELSKPFENMPLGKLTHLTCTAYHRCVLTTGKSSTQESLLLPRNTTTETQSSKRSNLSQDSLAHTSGMGMPQKDSY